jgi:Flp pilus assembly protein TadG
MLYRPNCQARIANVETPGRGASLHRRGAAAAEFAVIAILFVTLCTGAFEISRGIWAKEVLSDAARRAARTASMPGTSNTSIISDINNILTDNNLDSTKATITILVNDVVADASTAVQNDKISVKVAIPVSAIKTFTSAYLKTSSIESATVVMMRYD